MKTLLIVLLALVTFSCNKEIALDVDPQRTEIPDYNLLSEGAAFLYDPVTNKYRASPILYLRPFENVTPVDNITLAFSSNHFGSYIVQGDTLYNGDKINVKYGDFQRYLLAFTYLTETPGQHSIIVATTIRSIQKTTTINLQTP